MSRSLRLAPRRIRSMFAERRLRAARIVACDLDGTLLNADVMIGDRTASLIREIVDCGIEFVFITARHHYAAEPFSDDIRLNQTIISLDGALTRYPHGDVVANIAIPEALAAEVVQLTIDTPDADCALVTADRIRVSRRDMTIPRRHQHWNIDLEPFTVERREDEPALEMIVTGTFCAINTIYAHVRPHKLADCVRTRLYESESHGDVWYLELRSADACKLRALLSYTQTRGISLRNVVAIGDARNDIDFCAKAGYTVAVQNAVDQLKAMADYITAADCLDEGVNEFLEHFISNVRTTHA